MINARQKKLLTLLRASDQLTPIADYAQLLSCSPKTIFNDIKALNAELGESCPKSRIVAKQGAGVRLALDPNDENAFEHLMLLNAGSDMTSLERFYRGLYLIATHEREQLTIDELAHTLFTNKAQMQLEIKRWNEMLSFFDIAIRSRKGSIHLVGSELSIRAAIVFYFYQTTPYFQTQVVERTLAKDTRVLSDEILSIIEQNGRAPFSAIARRATMFYIDLALSRMRRGRFANQTFCNLAEENRATTEQIRAVLEKGLGKAVPEAETHLVMESRLLGGMRHGEPLNGADNSEAEALARDLRNEAETLFDQTLDRHTAQALETLMLQAILRGRGKFPVSLFSATPMKRCQLGYTIILERIISRLPRFKEHPLFADDLSRIAMLLLPFMSARTASRKRAIIVSNASFEVAYYAHHCITSAFPNLEIVAVASSDEATEMIAPQGGSAPIADLAIAFGPLDLPLPTCRISPAIDGRDVLRLHEFLLNLSREWRRGPFETSTRAIQETTIEDVTQAAYWNLKTDGLIQGTPEAFRTQFLGHAAISADGMTTAVCADNSSFTGMRIFETPHFYAVQPVRRIYTLIIASEDIPHINEIVEHFNSITGSSLSNEQSYGFPILIGKEHKVTQPHRRVPPQPYNAGGPAPCTRGRRRASVQAT